ncbi:hypothetical protein CTI14_40960, partial [Methylobacterium radiotolerans]
VLRATYAFVTQVLSYTLEVGEVSISLGNILVFADQAASMRQRLLRAGAVRGASPSSSRC